MQGEQRAAADDLVVEFDRDPVAAGDDAMSHGQSWRMAAGSDFEDVIRACVSQLASVFGTVGWLLTCCSRGRDVPFAFLLVSPRTGVVVHRLRAMQHKTPAWHAGQNGGVLRVYAQYHSGAAPTPLGSRR
ncbi:hypothetical protein [Georgenia sp. Z1491]|uniref:hypothetical protein n=1 Tax=Georgenia sp. Z1491 TaxID=3416707 RepID=UPI003CED35FD